MCDGGPCGDTFLPLTTPHVANYNTKLCTLCASSITQIFLKFEPTIV